MEPDAALMVAGLLIASLVVFPVVQASQRRHTSRECSEVAAGLIEFAGLVRREQRAVPLDESLLARVRKLQIPEVVTFELAQQLARPDPLLLAETAQRLALRLKRRVAFERKMLARTAPGRRRGALAAAAPGVALLSLRMVDMVPPLPALVLLIAVEALGGWLLWRVARVEV